MIKRIGLILCLLLSTAYADTIINDSGLSTQNFRVETDTYDGAIATSADINEVYIMRNGQDPAQVTFDATGQRVTIVTADTAIITTASIGGAVLSGTEISFPITTNITGGLTYSVTGNANLMHNEASENILQSSPAQFGTAFADIHDSLNLQLPSAGTYFIYANLRAAHDGDQNSYGSVRLWNQTDAAEVTDSIRLLIEIADATFALTTVSSFCGWVISVDSADEIRLQGMATQTGTIRVQADGNGYSTIAYIRLY